MTVMCNRCDKVTVYERLAWQHVPLFFCLQKWIERSCFQNFSLLKTFQINFSFLCILHDGGFFVNFRRVVGHGFLFGSPLEVVQ
jgi:hypothetical protein